MKQQTKQTWQECKLEDIGSFQYGYTASTKQDNTGFKFVRISDIEENGSINWKTVPFCNINSEEFEKFKLGFGDILFARIGATTGKTTFIDKKEKAVFASYLIRFTVKESIDSKFVYYFTQSRYYWDQAFKQREGQLKKGMNANVLSQIELSIPNLKEEQTAIAKILSTTDEALEALERERLATERLRRGFMIKLLEKKDNLVVIGDYINILPGYAFSSKKFSHEKKGLPLIRIRDIESKETDCYFDGEYPEEYLVKKGDILIGMDGEFNTCIWQGEKALLNQRVCKISPKNDLQLDQDYLYYIIQKPLKIIELTVGQTTVKHLSTKDFFKIQVPLPSLSEQKHIAEILSTIDKKLELQRARKEKIERVKKGLMDELLTGKKRVNVDKVMEKGK